MMAEASRSAGAHACDYKRDRLWVRFPRNSAEKRERSNFSVNIRLPLPTLLHEAYSVNLKKIKYKFRHDHQRISNVSNSPV